MPDSSGWTADAVADAIADAIEAVWVAHEALREATTLPQQASALTRLADAVSDLSTWHPHFNSDTGQIEDA